MGFQIYIDLFYHPHPFRGQTWHMEWEKRKQECVLCVMKLMKFRLDCMWRYVVSICAYKCQIYDAHWNHFAQIISFQNSFESWNFTSLHSWETTNVGNRGDIETSRVRQFY